MAYAPDRGDAVWLFFDGHSGHEQSGRRPAIVLSPRAYNTKTGMALVCPITSQRKGYPFEVELGDGLPISGVVLADQVRCMDWRGRKATPICELPRIVVETAIGKLHALLD